MNPPALDASSPERPLGLDEQLCAQYVAGVPTVRALGLWLLTSACATAPAPRPEPPFQAQARPTANPRIQWVSTSAGVSQNAAWIGEADLEKARALLSEARNELEPRQWQLLQDKFVDAELAFDRFNGLARVHGVPAEVPRAEGGPSEARGTGEATKGLGKLRAAGPLLALLLLLRPSERIAGPDHDFGPELLTSQRDFETKLRELSQAAQQVTEELAAARQVPAEEAAGRDRLPRPNRVFRRDDWKPGPGESELMPCTFAGGGEPGLPPGWVRCTFTCGAYVVILNDIWGSSSDDCKEPRIIERANKDAEHRARVKDRRQ